MKILAIQNLYRIDAAGGTELLLADFIEGLSRRGHDVSVLAGRDSVNGGENVFPRLLLPRDLHRAEKGIGDAMAWWQRAIVNRWTVAATIRKFGPDVVWVHNFEYLTASIIGAALASGVPTVIHCHNHAFRQYLLSLRKKVSLPLRFGILPGDSQMKRIRAIAISAFVGESLAGAGFPRDRISVLPNAIPDQFFTPMAPLDGERQRRWLYLGAVSRHKGPHLLIEAFAALDWRDKGLTLDIVGPEGDPSYVSGLRHLIEKTRLADAVRLLSPLPRGEVPGLLDEHGVLFVPSLWEEPYGLVAAEGMARGLVVVASRRGALPEVVGNQGLLFEPDRIGELASIMRELTAEPNRMTGLGQAARQRAERSFRLEELLSGLEKMLRGTTKAM